MGLSITWVTATIFWFFFFFLVHVIWIHNCWSLKLALHTQSATTKWAEMLIPNIQFGAARGKQRSVLSLLSLPCEGWWRSRGDFTLNTALPRLPADRTLWFSCTPFRVSPGPNLCSRGFSGKYNMPIWMDVFEWSVGSCAEEPDLNRPVLTLPTFCGQVGSVGYWRKCLILTCEKQNLKPTHSGFSGKTIFLGMPVTILGRKQCGNFQIQIKIRCKRSEARLEKKRSWQNTTKQVKNCLLFLSPFPSLSSQLLTRKAAFHLNFHHAVSIIQKSTAWK